MGGVWHQIITDPASGLVTIVPVDSCDLAFRRRYTDGSTLHMTVHLVRVSLHVLIRIGLLTHNNTNPKQDIS